MRCHLNYEYEITLSDSTTIETNAIIFAVGGPAFNKIIQSSSFITNKVITTNPEQHS